MNAEFSWLPPAFGVITAIATAVAVRSSLLRRRGWMYRGRRVLLRLGRYLSWSLRCLLRWCLPHNRRLLCGTTW